jgi:hypothetical protein
MSTASRPTFKLPPSVKCIAQGHCLGVGRKVYYSKTVCATCLKRYDCQQLRIWASNDTSALALVQKEYVNRQLQKRNIESCNRYLCAFEDPDFEHCRWRHRDLNLRGTRLNCNTVRRKGTACKKCWNRRIRKIRVLQYFTPTALCHEELERIVRRPEDAGEGAVEEDQEEEEEEEDDDDDDDDDVEGYHVTFG